MTMYVTHARRWEYGGETGWELDVDGLGITQVEALDEADAQVRDFVETMTGVSADDVRIKILIEGAAV